MWILRRTLEMLERLGDLIWREALRHTDSEVRDQQPECARNEYRSPRPDLLVEVVICTHLGCIPTFRRDAGAEDLRAAWMGGYVCQCHGSRFDLAGPVVEGVPAPTNLIVPPYRYLDDDTIEIGFDPGRA